MEKRIILCADDYGQAVSISQGILILIQQKRLSATSCLVNFPDWHTHAHWLKPYMETVDVGLHFNLTEGSPLSEAYTQTYGDTFFPLSALLKKAMLGQLSKHVIAVECHAQLDQWVAGFGRLPDFIDGHQHVHQFPMIREALIQVYQERLGGTRAYIRLVNPRFTLWEGRDMLKQAMIYATGTHGLGCLLQQHAIPHNTSFAGIYRFQQAGEYASRFPRFLQQLTHGGLLMCHPGLATDTHHSGLKVVVDPIAKAREAEFQYLASDQFFIELSRFGYIISKYKAL